MEVFGALASGAALFELLARLRKLGSNIKGARQEWEKYLSSLDSLAHMQAAIRDVVGNLGPSPGRLRVTIDGRQQDLLAFCDANLEKVVHDAKDLLGTLKGDKRKRTGIKRVKAWLKSAGRKCLFVIRQDRIRDLIQTVEYAKSSLLVAMTTIVLSQADSGHTMTQEAIRKVEGQITAQTLALDDIIRQRQQQPETPIEIYFEAVCPEMTSLLRIRDKGNKHLCAPIQLDAPSRPGYGNQEHASTSDPIMHNDKVSEDTSTSIDYSVKDTVDVAPWPAHNDSKFGRDAPLTNSGGDGKLFDNHENCGDGKRVVKAKEVGKMKQASSWVNKESHHILKRLMPFQHSHSTRTACTHVVGLGSSR